MTALNVDPRAVYDMNRKGDAIGCLWVAAHEYHQQPTMNNYARLLRTKYAAQQAGVDNTTITQTSQLARTRKEEST